MKKTAGFLLSLMVCLSFGIMATSCGMGDLQSSSSGIQSEESGNTDENSSNDGESGGSEDESSSNPDNVGDDNSSNSDTENDKDDAEINEKTGLTKEEWDEVFANTIDSDNFTAEMERSMVYGNGDVWNDTMFFKSTQNAVEMV